jgi:DnaJ-class molecular chaperone
MLMTMPDDRTPGDAPVPCPTCAGRGLVWADLRRFRLGPGFAAFMAAGTRQRHGDDGSCHHELVCHHCDGTGKRGGGAGGA